MKKVLLAGTFLLASMGASASVITFDDSSFGGAGVTFDTIDFRTDEVGTVTQTDSGSGDIFLPEYDNFNEVGTGIIAEFLLGGTGIDPVGYEIFLDYDLDGQVAATSSAFGPIIQVLFDGGDAGLYADTNVDDTFLGAADANTTKIGEFGITNGECLVTPSVGGSCTLNFNFMPVAGYFFWQGVDIVDHLTDGAVALASMSVRVDSIVGLDPFYSNGPVQVFDVVHDSDMTITVAEPTSIAILGLGLLGLARIRRKA